MPEIREAMEYGGLWLSELLKQEKDIGNCFPETVVNKLFENERCILVSKKKMF